MRDINFVATWNLQTIPMACCTEVGYTLAGDWALPAAGSNPEAWFRAYIPGRMAALGVPLDFPGVLMLDWEDQSTAPFWAYGAMLDVARSVLPRATLGVWTSLPVGGWAFPASLLDSIRRGRAALLPCIYQQRVESPAAAQEDVAELLAGCAVAAPGVPLMPCLGVGVGWQHPAYPAGTDGLEPMCALENILARRAAVAALAADYNLTACAWWQSARVGDVKRVAALSWIGNKIRTRVATMRADANVPALAPGVVQ